MIQSRLKKLVQAFGPDTVLSWVRWAPSSDATQTLTEAHGVSSITRTASLAELIVLANELRTDYTAHIADDTSHVAPDETNVLTAAAATDLPTVITLLNELRTQYTAHIADTDAHDPADSTNVLAAAAATDRETAVTLAADLKAKYNAHLADATSHDAADVTNTIAAVMNVAGAYRINLKQKGGALFPVLGTIDNGTTLYYFLDTTDLDPTNGTVDIRLRSVAFASVASGPAATDTIDELCALVFQPKNLTKRCGAKGELRGFGPKCEIAYARWAPSASAAQTLTEAQGITGIARTGAGAYTVTLSSPCEAMVAFISYIENDTTHYHVADVAATSASAGTFTVRHRSVAYASVASGPTSSDTVDQLEVLVLKRMAT
jgi:uncharacterized protein YlxP (DUF503 family)